MDNILYFIPSAGILALLFVYLKNNWVASKEVGSEKMDRIAKNIADGAMAFLRAEYKILSFFVFIIISTFVIPKYVKSIKTNSEYKEFLRKKSRSFKKF